MSDNRQCSPMILERGEPHEWSPTVAHNLSAFVDGGTGRWLAEHSHLTELGKQRLELGPAAVTGLLRGGYQREWSFEEQNSRNLYDALKGFT